MNTNEKRSQIRGIVDKVMLGRIKLKSSKSIHSPEDAASKFIEVLRNEISSSGLSAEAASAISNLDYGSAYKTGDNTYQIYVYFTGDLSRPSLDSNRYPSGIDDIAEMFNYGAPKDGHKMHPVYGEWHGKETWSKTVIPGAHFMEQAVRDFIGNYATEYNVVDITIKNLKH